VLQETERMVPRKTDSEAYSAETSSSKLYIFDSSHYQSISDIHSESGSPRFKYGALYPSDQNPYDWVHLQKKVQIRETHFVVYFYTFYET
jgi:hypothetical protein